MKQQKFLSEMVSMVYDAASHPDLWTPFLEKLSDAVSGEATALVFRDLPSLKGHLSVHVRIDPSAVASYEKDYWQTDFRIKRAHQRPNLIVAGNTFIDPPKAISEEELAKSTIYNEFLRRQGIFYRLVGVISAQGPSVSAITTMRRREKSIFTSSDASIIQQLLPDLQRGLQLQRYIADLNTRAEASKSALDHWTVGWLLVDMDSRVLLMNRAAETLINRRDGLEMSRGILIAHRAEDSSRLKTYIRSASCRLPAFMGAGGALPLQRPSGKRPLSIIITPGISDVCSLYPQKTTAMLFITDPELRSRLGLEPLRKLYGFTPAELRLAERLVLGCDLKTAADQLQITKETARGYLKQIFQKTRVKRQPDLVRLLLMSTVHIDLD